jgi:hypothetical protein
MNDMAKWFCLKRANNDLLSDDEASEQQALHDKN